MLRLLKPAGVSRREPTRIIPTFEVLEDRLTPDSRLLPISGNDHLFDELRHVIYATNLGTIQRYDLNTNQVLPAWNIGRSLLGMDITPDGQYLVVAEQDCPGTTGSREDRSHHPD